MRGWSLRKQGRDRPPPDEDGPLSRRTPGNLPGKLNRRAPNATFSNGILAADSGASPLRVPETQWPLAKLRQSIIPQPIEF